MMTISTNADKRLIQFEGIHNFRDMGGYQSTDGRKVKKGLLYRSAELAGMTKNDKEVLKSLNIKYFFDYRDKLEASHKPDPKIDGITYERVAANKIETTTNYSFEDLVHTYKEFNGETLRKMYEFMYVNNLSYKRLFHIIQDKNNLGLVHHCAVGKDRTGLGAALIFLALDIQKKTVIEDYMLSNQYLKTLNQSILTKLDQITNVSVLKVAEDLLSAKEEYIETFFSVIAKEYGNLDNYFLEEYDLTLEKRDNLKNLYLE